LDTVDFGMDLSCCCAAAGFGIGLLRLRGRAGNCELMSIDYSHSRNRPAGSSWFRCTWGFETGWWWRILKHGLWQPELTASGRVALIHRPIFSALCFTLWAQVW